MLIPADTFFPEELAQLESLQSASFADLFRVTRRRPTQDAYGSAAQSFVAIGFVLGAIAKQSKPREVVRGGVLQPVTGYQVTLARTLDLRANDRLQQYGTYRIELGKPSAGTWTAHLGASVTAALAYNISLAALQTALEGLVGVGAGNVAVFGLSGQVYAVELLGTARTGQTALTAADVSLTGGSVLVNQPLFEVLDCDWGLADATTITAECVQVWM